MKILNIVLGVVCAVAVGGAAMLFTQKSRALADGQAQRERVGQLQNELAELQTNHDALTKERDTLVAETGDLEKQLGSATSQAKQASDLLLRARSKAEGLDRELRAKTAELRAKQQEVGKLSQARQRLISTFTKELREREVEITQMGDSLTLEMVGGILFRSGQVSLSEQGMEVLQRVGEAIKDVADRQIRIEGHTDNVPIRRRKDMYETNWELSAARATNVVRYLIDNLGVAPERLEATAMSQYHPIADNGTAEGREKNRRIVIKLAPIPKDVPAGIAVPEEPAATEGE